MIHIKSLKVHYSNRHNLYRVIDFIIRPLAGDRSEIMVVWRKSQEPLASLLVTAIDRANANIPEASKKLCVLEVLHTPRYGQIFPFKKRAQFIGRKRVRRKFSQRSSADDITAASIQIAIFLNELLNLHSRSYETSF